MKKHYTLRIRTESVEVDDRFVIFDQKCWVKSFLILLFGFIIFSQVWKSEIRRKLSESDLRVVCISDSKNQNIFGETLMISVIVIQSVKRVVWSVIPSNPPNSLCNKVEKIETTDQVCTHFLLFIKNCHSFVSVFQIRWLIQKIIFDGRVKEVVCERATKMLIFAENIVKSVKRRALQAYK